MTFFKGQKVRIRSDVKKYTNGSYYNLTGFMYEHRGEICTILEKGAAERSWKLKEFPRLGWHEEWLEPLDLLEKELFEI